MGTSGGNDSGVFNRFYYLSQSSNGVFTWKQLVKSRKSAIFQIQPILSGVTIGVLNFIACHLDMIVAFYHATGCVESCEETGAPLMNANTGNGQKATTNAS